MADQLVLSLDATHSGTYHQRGVNSLQNLFRSHFPELCTRYEADFAKALGKFRMERISKAVGRFLECGDYTNGIARIQCTNPKCKSEYFRPFSCKVFHLCPSCSQKRTLLFGEYMNEQLLLRLPHRQFVFTIPKVLRVFFRHDRRLHGEVSRLVYGLVAGLRNGSCRQAYPHRCGHRVPELGGVPSVTLARILPAIAISLRRRE